MVKSKIGKKYIITIFLYFPRHFLKKLLDNITPIFFRQNQQAWWRNGSASDSSSEGCVFKSRPGHSMVFRQEGERAN